MQNVKYTSVIDKYNSEIEETIDILSNKVPSLKFSSVNIYGSAINEDLFKAGFSDIDIILMSGDFSELNLESICKEIFSLGFDFCEKYPNITQDSLCKRIEFYLKYPNSDIRLDLTIAPGLIPSMERLEKDACYDFFEALMGGVYQSSIPIYGKIPDYDRFKNEFDPFFSEDLRIKRMDMLADRISRYSREIERLIISNNPELFEYVIKIRPLLIKFIYIYYRKYFLSPVKHTDYQLKKILNLSKYERYCLSFTNGTLDQMAMNFVELANSYISSYEDEKRTNNKVLIRGGNK